MMQKYTELHIMIMQMWLNEIYMDYTDNNNKLQLSLSIMIIRVLNKKKVVHH